MVAEEIKADRFVVIAFLKDNTCRQVLLTKEQEDILSEVEAMVLKAISKKGAVSAPTLD